MWRWPWDLGPAPGLLFPWKPSREGWGGRPPAFPTAASAEDEGFLLAVVRLAAEAEAHAGVEGAEVSLEPLRDAAMTELHRDRVE